MVYCYCMERWNVEIPRGITEYKNDKAFSELRRLNRKVIAG